MILQTAPEKNGFAGLNDVLKNVLNNVELELDEYGFPKLPPLTVPAETAEQLRRRLIASGFPPVYLDRPPSEYLVDGGNREAIETARELVNSPDGKRGLYICGGFGTGKTWLAVLIGRKMAERGEYVCFGTLPKITDALMDAASGERGIMRERYTKRAKLLVIDDIGKETPNKGRLDTLFEVLDTREKNKLLTILTSNYNLAELCRRITPEKGEGVTAEAIKDRLRCFEAVFLGGESRRGKYA